MDILGKRVAERRLQSALDTRLGVLTLSQQHADPASAAGVSGRSYFALLTRFALLGALFLFCETRLLGCLGCRNRRIRFRWFR
jgi:hypothetical protein